MPEETHRRLADAERSNGHDAAALSATASALMPPPAQLQNSEG
jgi:hypothetical protein